MIRHAVPLTLLAALLGLAGCPSRDRSDPASDPAILPGPAREVRLSFERTGTGDYPAFEAVVEALEDGTPSRAPLTVRVTPVGPLPSPVVACPDGTWRCTVTPTESGEIPVTAAVDDWGLSVRRTALVFQGVDEGWGQPVAVPGDAVNTPGWEDGACISPDGEWLFVHYSPMRISGFLTMDPAHPWAVRCVGPWAVPERPDFPRGRISDDGFITHSFPLYGMDSLPWPLPPTILFGFRRQPDGSFAEPFRIGPDDSGNGCLGTFGPCLLQGGAGPRLVFAFNDPRTTGPGDTESDIYVDDLVLGQPNELGAFFRNESTGEIYATGFDARRMGFDASGHQGNPHAHADAGGNVLSIWVDDETVPENDRDVMVYERTGTFPDGPWTGPTTLPAPVNLAGVGEIQPFFDGATLFVRRGHDIVAVDWRGGPFAQAASWDAGVAVLRPDPLWSQGRLVTSGEPTVCTRGGRRILYFVYATVVGYDPSTSLYDFDLDVGFVEERP